MVEIGEPVEFYSEGYKLIGNLHLPYENAPCILLLHGLVSSKDSEKWLTFACRLEDEGYAALRFNFRGCGWGDEWSEGKFEDTTLTNRVKDYKAALDFLSTKKVDMNRVGVIGSSFGGMVALATKEKVKAMVVMATSYRLQPTQTMLDSFKEKGYYENPIAQEPRMSTIRKDLYDDLEEYDILRCIKETTSPLLIIHGSKDEVIPVEDAYKLYANANEPKRLEIVEDGTHTFVDGGHLDKVIEFSVQHFKKYL